jgi:glycosyltransferase involved in cell wall biosynthesis
MNEITIGVPAFKAHDHICDCLSSIQIQTIKKDVKVIIANDNPSDNYDYLKNRYKDLDITILDCKENTGPGLARQRCLDACETNYITFIDADDVFFSPFSLEMLRGGIKQNVIEVQGVFLQEVRNHPQGVRTAPQNNRSHPWVFGRLYNVDFLRKTGIEFSDLRAMEDGEFNWKIRMLIEGTELKINYIQDPVYLWRVGSEHSITRSNIDKDGIPQYNFDLCQLGATIASIRAVKFCRDKNPFNGIVDKFITEMMIGCYFTYVECKAKKELFADQNFFNAKRLYHECFVDVESRISDKVLSDMYTVARSQNANRLIGVIPDITFFDFMNKVKTDPYNGEEELKEIRSKFPQEVIDADIKTGVATF